MPNYPEVLSSFSHKNLKVTNFEMETSALYGLSKALGHHACTLCAIIANRKTKQFSENHELPINRLILHVLNNFLSSPHYIKQLFVVNVSSLRWTT